MVPSEKANISSNNVVQLVHSSQKGGERERESTKKKMQKRPGEKPILLNSACRPFFMFWVSATGQTVPKQMYTIRKFIRIVDDDGIVCPPKCKHPRKTINT